MTKFIYGLDDDATEIQKALIADGLAKRFPDVEFDLQSNPSPFLENNIIPLMSRPHPSDPDCMVIEVVPNALRVRIKEAFDDLLASSAHATAS